MAFEVAELMSFGKHELLVNMYFAKLYEEPVKDYHKITLEQIYDADLEVFNYMAGQTEAGFQVMPPGQYPLDEHVEQAMKTLRVAQTLAHKQKSVHTPPNSSQPSSGSQGFDSVTAKQMKAVTKKLLKQQAKQPPKGKQSKNGGGGGKGAGKPNRGGNGKPVVPSRLKGLEPFVDGERTCFAFNLDGCSSGGGRCSKGVHKCMRCGSEDHGACSSRCKKKHN